MTGDSQATTMHESWAAGARVETTARRPCGLRARLAGMCGECVGAAQRSAAQIQSAAAG